MGKSHDLATGVAYQDQTETDARYHTKTASDAAYAAKSGDTFTGDVNLNGGNFYLADDDAAAHRYMFLNTGASQDGHIVLRRALANKYQVTAKPDNSYSIYGYPAGGEVYNINSSGFIKKPKQPHFVLQGNYNGWTYINQTSQWLPLTGSAGVGTSTNNELAMAWTSGRSGGSESAGNGMNKSNGIYTAPITGTYMFTFQSYILKGAAGGGYIHINSYINGSDQMDYTIYGYNANGGVYVTPEITKVIRMAANDTFAFRLYTNVSDYRIYPYYTCLCGYLLG